jgi:DNA-binding response OmpR family regulator
VGKILIVEDDSVIADSMARHLSTAGFDPIVVGRGELGLARLRFENPDVCVLDLMLPELDGRAVIRAVRRDEEAGATPILVLSARGTTIDRIAGLEDGADDYLPKPFSPAELVVRVKAILRRAAQNVPASAEPISPTGASVAAAPIRSIGGRIAHNDLVLDPERHEVTVAGVMVQLTHVEFRLLQTLLEADGRVLSRDQLLDAVWGAEQSEVLDRTVDVHIRRLRDKLGDDPDAPRYVATVRGAGYRSAPVAG